MAKSKIKVKKIAGVEESHINVAELESKEAIAESDANPRVIKLRKYSLESTIKRKKPVAKREVLRIIQPKFIPPKQKLQSNTDIHFLDKSLSNGLLSESQLHDAVDRFVNADFSEDEEADFNEDPTLLDTITHLSDRSLDASFFDAGKLDNAFIAAEQPVDFRNVETLISNTSPPSTSPQPNNTINQFLADFNDDLKKAHDLALDLEELLDLHVEMIGDSDLEDETEELNAFQPIDDTVPIFQTLAYL